MTTQPTADRQEKGGLEPAPDHDVAVWMVLQIAARIRRARTRQELHRVSERDLDRMSLTRFDVGN